MAGVKNTAADGVPPETTNMMTSSSKEPPLPNYHFKVRTDSHVMLSEVVDLPNAEQARIEASRRVGALLTEHAGKIWADQNWQMDVTDNVGLILFVLHLSDEKPCHERK
jgi:hypothetical protein